MNKMLIKFIGLLVTICLALGQQTTYEYKVEDILLLNYDDAQAYCRAWGGDLATVTDNLEQTITNILKNIRYTRVSNGFRDFYLIGAKKEAAGDLSSLKWPTTNEGFTLWNGITM
jgi:hypothetical protein